MDYRNGFDGKYCVIGYKHNAKNLVPKNIIYIESNINYTIFYTESQTVYSSKHLKFWENELKDFKRIHQRFLINPDFIKTLNENSITLSTGKTLEVSRRKLTTLNQMKNLLTLLLLFVSIGTFAQTVTPPVVYVTYATVPKAQVKYFFDRSRDYAASYPDSVGVAFYNSLILTKNYLDGTYTGPLLNFQLDRRIEKFITQTKLNGNPETYRAYKDFQYLMANDEILRGQKKIAEFSILMTIQCTILTRMGKVCPVNTPN